MTKASSETRPALSESFDLIREILILLLQNMLSRKLLPKQKMLSWTKSKFYMTVVCFDDDVLDTEATQLKEAVQREGLGLRFFTGKRTESKRQRKKKIEICQTTVRPSQITSEAENDPLQPTAMVTKAPITEPLITL